MATPARGPRFARAAGTSLAPCRAEVSIDMLTKAAVVVLALAVTCAEGVAQKKRCGPDAPKPGAAPAAPGERAVGSAPDAGALDPYTKNDPKAMLRAGYVGFGPFEVGDGHDTKAVAALLGDTAIAWAETSHFKIGCSLAPLPLPPGKDGQALVRDLEQLKKLVPGVEPRPKVLSTWLRLHVYALRLEQLYADVQRRLGVGDESFPGPKDAIDYKSYRGEGPYLGQRGKYVVLLLDRASSFGRYARAFLDTRQRFTVRHLFRLADSMLLSTCEEFAEGRFRDDAALHCHVVFNVVHNLLDGYRHYNHDLPVWFKEGLAQWHVRRIDPRFTSWSTASEWGADWRPVADWAPVVRGLVETGSVPPARTTMRWLDYGPAKFADRVVFWSRVDWLMTMGDAKLRVFLDTLKEPFDRTARLPDPAEVAARQDLALHKAWGLDLDSFDHYWAAWVKKSTSAR